MGVDWNEVLELALQHPDLIRAILYILAFWCVAIGVAAVITWLLRGAIDRGQIRRLESTVSLLEKQVEYTEDRLDMAIAEQSRLEKKIRAKEPDVSIEKTAATALNFLKMAAASNTSARNIILSVPRRYDRLL